MDCGCCWLVVQLGCKQTSMYCMDSGRVQVGRKHWQVEGRLVEVDWMKKEAKLLTRWSTLKPNGHAEGSADGRSGRGGCATMGQ